MCIVEQGGNLFRNLQRNAFGGRQTLIDTTEYGEPEVLILPTVQMAAAISR